MLLHPCKGWGLTPTPSGRSHLHGVRRRAGRWTLAHAHQRPLSHPPQWRRWGPAVRTEGGDEDKDSDALSTLERVLPPGPPSLHSPLQCCRWRLSGGCTHSLQHKAVDSGEATHRSTCPSDKGGPTCGCHCLPRQPQMHWGVRTVPRMTGPPGLFWASLSGWLLQYWFR